MSSEDNSDNLSSNSKQTATQVIQTPAGPIIGKCHRDTHVAQFLGIPYAQPPLGKLRWQPPQRMPRWENPLRAMQYGMPAAQNPSLLFQVHGPNGELPESEDCLYLNIFAPEQALDSEDTISNRLPVMLWIHGGSFYLGAGSQELYNGNFLAAGGRAIVVTINYRLGALGFLRLCDNTDIPATGNEGLLDQIAALKWVRENIACFGGDPQNITLFGESAGAMSVTALFTALYEVSEEQPDKYAHGLFQKAIIQSGNPCAFYQPEKANSMAQAFIEYLHTANGGKPLLEATTRELLQAQAAILSDPRMEQSWGQLPFKPVIDGQLISNSPVDALRSGAGAEVSLMLGSNLDEWNLFSVANPESFTLDDTQIRARLQWLLPEPVLSPILEHYRQAAEKLSANPWPLWSRTWNLMLTDMVFTLPGLRLLDAHKGRRFHYHFAQPLAAQPLLGACHAAELGYIFGTHNDESLQTLYGAELNPHHLSERMREAWLNFAEHGDPGQDWPAFDAGHSRRFGEYSEERVFEPAQLAALWQDISDEQLRGYL